MTAALAVLTDSTSAPFVRVRPAPPLDPPFDDEPGLPPAGLAMLPMEWPPAPRAVRTAHPARPPQRRHPPATAGRPGQARAAAQRFVGVCVEVLNGFRPATHLRPMAAAADLPAVTDQVLRRTARVYLGGAAGNAGRDHRVRVRSLRVCEPRDGVAELAVVLMYRESTWAMAARLERQGQAWLCKLVQVL
jgi:hypothetical protein